MDPVELDMPAVQRRISDHANRIYREKRFKTQTEMAFALGMAQSHLSGILNHSRPPGLEFLLRLARLTRDPLEKLCFEEVKQEPADARRTQLAADLQVLALNLETMMSRAAEAGAQSMGLREQLAKTDGAVMHAFESATQAKSASERAAAIAKAQALIATKVEVEARLSQAEHNFKLSRERMDTLKAEIAFLRARLGEMGRE
jgi:transcriptional regulator with XRE-family HTH domain